MSSLTTFNLHTPITITTKAIENKSNTDMDTKPDWEYITRLYDE